MMLKKTLLYLDEHVLFPVRRNYLQERLCPLLTKGDRILDLGASDGRLAAKLGEKCPLSSSDVMFTSPKRPGFRSSVIPAKDYRLKISLLTVS